VLVNMINITNQTFVDTLSDNFIIVLYALLHYQPTVDVLFCIQVFVICLT